MKIYNYELRLSKFIKKRNVFTFLYEVDDNDDDDDEEDSVDIA